MQRILITGGAGFVGSNIANHFADQGKYRVVVCDAFGQSEKWRNLSKHFIYEIIPPQELFYWLEHHVGDLKAVIHLGSISSTTERNVDAVLENNFALSKSLWYWCAEKQKPFIFSSSYATYGDGEEGFDDDISRQHLNRLRPLNAYGWSKHLFDQFVATHAEQGDPTPSQWAGLKFFNIYGPNEYHKGAQQSVVAQIFPHVRQGRPVHLFKSYRDDVKDGEQKRDFIYIKDVVKVVDWLIANPNVSGLFNLGSGEARSFNELAQAAFAAMGKEPRIAYNDMPEGLAAKYQYFTQAKIDRLRQAGYTEPMTRLEDGVRDYVLNYLVKDDPYL